MSSNVTPRPTSTRTATTYRAAAQAAHEEHCDRCRAASQADAAFVAANGASMARRDRKQLGLILDMTAPAVTS
ncbi:hypothetical protein [Streptomyces sp. WAC01280]|uniref:hypothetical protein n=1 Tax=Streptomyces sp. WAC01280 TaxID=2487424 RepID=UPI000F7765DC|nr:hypothetical protein [Streptomyces sp. WAC01280]RSS59861.1 hypothetical protein EF909_08355 [Streptomyces sp. WAC01280]